MPGTSVTYAPVNPGEGRLRKRDRGQGKTQAAGQTSFQIPLAERQGKAYTLVGSEGEDGFAILSPQKVGDASHRVRL